MNNRTITDYVKAAHSNAKDKGFYDTDTRNIGEALMLIVSELGEALEAHRKGIHTIPYARQSLHGPNLKITNTEWKELFEDIIKDTFEDEIADVFIRLFDLCGYLNIPIEQHIQMKMKYNATRPIRHGKEY